VPSPVETPPPARERHLALIGAALAASLVGCTKTVIVQQNPSAPVPTTPVAATTACVDKSAADAILREFLADLKMNRSNGLQSFGPVADNVNRLADLFADYPSISIPMRKAARD
jgi:hypothetical protein